MNKQKQNLVMVVDDEKVVRDVLCIFLEIKGFKTVALENSSSIIKHAISENPEVVFLDIKMPGIDGIEACKKLNQIFKSKRMTKPAPDPGIFILTGSDSPESLKDSFSAGAVDFIKKPFDLEDVYQKIKTWIDTKGIEDKAVRINSYTEKIKNLSFKKLKSEIKF